MSTRWYPKVAKLEIDHAADEKSKKHGRAIVDSGKGTATRIVGLARGDALPVIGAILGHSDVKTTSRYAHLADDPVRQSVDGISESVAAAFSGSPSAKVFGINSRNEV